jgi:hypothetical protein
MTASMNAPVQARLADECAVPATGWFLPPTYYFNEGD